jgi:hypothetical protein
MTDQTDDGANGAKCELCGHPKPENIHHLWACCGDGPCLAGEVKRESLDCVTRRFRLAESELAKSKAECLDWITKASDWQYIAEGDYAPRIAALESELAAERARVAKLEDLRREVTSDFADVANWLLTCGWHLPSFVHNRIGKLKQRLLGAQQAAPPPASPLLDALPRRQGEGMPVEAGAAEREGPACDQYCPHPGNFNQCHSGDGGDCWCACHRVELGEKAPEEAPAQGEKAEPASPVLPGGFGPDYVTRAELAKAARAAAHRGYLRDDAQNALHALADELERKR